PGPGIACCHTFSCRPVRSTRCPIRIHQSTHRLCEMSCMELSFHSSAYPKNRSSHRETEMPHSEVEHAILRCHDRSHDCRSSMHRTACRSSVSVPTRRHTH